jgi:hypothetical protein
MAIVLNGTTGITSPAGTIGSGTLSSGATTITAASGQGAPLTLTTTDAGANTQTVYQGTARTFQVGTGNSSSGFANNLFVYDGTAGATVLQQGRSTYSLALQGANPVAGTGISFPASQNASSDANTLDDYEEGTWTPQAWQGATQITSPNDAYGRYIKIGNVIWIGAYFYKASGAPSASGQWQIRGLPFNVNSVKSGVNAATAGYNGVNGTQSTQVARWQANSSTALELYGQYGTTSWTSSYIEFSFSGCLEAG